MKLNQLIIIVYITYFNISKVTGNQYNYYLLGVLHFEASQVVHGEESVCQCRRRGFNPRVGRSPGEKNGNPLQYSCLGNSIDRGDWWATVHGVTKSQIQLSD